MGDPTNPGNPRPVAIIRLLVGWVFVVEGILKFLWPDDVGAGRFTSIGIPLPHVMAPFVGLVEICCGLLVILGLLTRLAGLVLLIDISVAIVSTKIPIWLEHGYWRFSLPKLKHYGLLSMLHEARTDISMLLGLIFLLVAGPGRWAMDARSPASRQVGHSGSSPSSGPDPRGSGPESFG